MRFANPDGVRGIRLATLHVRPFWSGFGLCCNTGALPYSPANTAKAAKVGSLKQPDACSAPPLLVSIATCSIRPDWIPGAAVRYGGGWSKRALSSESERPDLGKEAQVT